ncbi:MULTISPECIES: polyketide cyclase [Dyella]|uniref:Polyketide cyclase n=2 Tax=Dyella TaxID=231454 RepID=A0A4R0YYA2_9GAMM|nr:MULTISPECIES: polyketide cyclase [Dyella]TBR38798.1 polyketide cyclase [Dyella terrae]TCI13611.1 polyketide cyclase [Dyella soli]
MMRVLEFIVALVIVAIAGVVVGVIMPSTGHVERSLVVGKDMRQVYDVLANFRRFPDFTVQRKYDRNVKFTHSGKGYGPGAEISWDSSDDKVGKGKLTVATATPDFDKVDSTAKKAQIVWNLDNDWRGQDKHFTLDLERQGSRGQLTKITWSYDVAYGFNLIDRYSNLYIHGDPDSFIQFSLTDLQNVLASVQNIDYSKLIPYIEQTQPTPVLLVSTSIERKGGLEALDEATAKAEQEIQAAAKKLGVTVTGPRIIYTTNYGDQNYTFDVALPISASSLTINGQSHDLVAAKAPDLNAPAASSSTADAANADTNAPGSTDRFGRLIVDANVRGLLAFGGPALKGVWNGTAAGVPQTRDMLKAYAQTHGYKFDEVVNRFYDILAKAEEKKGDEVTSYAQYAVYLPLSDAPEKTPEQEAGLQPPSLDAGTDQAPASSGTAAAPAAASSAAQ